MIRRHLPLLFLALTLSGCGGARKPMRAMLGRPTQLTLLPIVAPNANAGSSIEVEVVTAADQATLNQLLTFTSQFWFQNHAGTSAVRTPRISTSSTTSGFPARPSHPSPSPAPCPLPASSSFANYSSPGSHATVLPLAATVRLQLNAADLAIQILP